MLQMVAGVGIDWGPSCRARGRTRLTSEIQESRFCATTPEWTLDGRVLVLQYLVLWLDGWVSVVFVKCEGKLLG